VFIRQIEVHISPILLRKDFLLLRLTLIFQDCTSDMWP
jgi:hypothetical protein